MSARKDEGTFDPAISDEEWNAYADNPDCPMHPNDGVYRPVTTEIEGRVLVCDECANDEELRAHARKDWR